MIDWHSMRIKVSPKHTQGEGDARETVFHVGGYDIFLPGEVEEIKIKRPDFRNHRDGDPRATFPSLEVREGELRLQIEDLVGHMLSMSSPEELAVALWKERDVRLRFIDALSERYSQSNVDEGDRREFLAKVKAAVHSVSLDRVAGYLHKIEYVLSKWYAIDAFVVGVNRLLEMHNIRKSNGQMSDAERADVAAGGEPPFLTVRDPLSAQRLQIGWHGKGTTWEEASAYWREAVKAAFPPPDRAAKIEGEEEALGRAVRGEPLEGYTTRDPEAPALETTNPGEGLE